MNSNPVREMPAREQPAPDEWGLYDPNDAGLAAAIRALDGRRTASTTEKAATDGTPEAVTPAAAAAAASLQAKPQGAIYTLEGMARCFGCSRDIRTVRVLRLLRSQVSFTSMLPRKGYVVACPECGGVLAVGLSGLV